MSVRGELRRLVLRGHVVQAKRDVAQALRVNAAAENEGACDPPFSREEVDVLRLELDLAVLVCRDAGVDVSDLVGPNVGRL